jgi:hypothetical protein
MSAELNLESTVEEDKPVENVNVNLNVSENIIEKGVEKGAENGVEKEGEKAKGTTKAVSNVHVFKLINNFVEELSNVFGQKQKGLLLYKRLLEKTGLIHDKPIIKHVEAFKTFCVNNRESIFEMDYLKIKDSKISYSDNVYIDMKTIFKMSDPSTSKVIWRHVLTISAFVDPENNTRSLLVNAQDKQHSSDEKEIIDSFIAKIGSSVDLEKMNKDNPMETVGKLMASGVLTDSLNSLQKGLKNGSLNMGKLLATIQNTCAGLSKDGAGGGGGGGGLGAGMPDLTSMMSLMSTMNFASGASKKDDSDDE